MGRRAAPGNRAPASARARRRSAGSAQPELGRPTAEATDDVVELPAPVDVVVDVVVVVVELVVVVPLVLDFLPTFGTVVVVVVVGVDPGATC